MDTADVYGEGANEQLVGQALAGRRDQVVLATKFGLQWPRGGGAMPTGVNGSPEYPGAPLMPRCSDSACGTTSTSGICIGRTRPSRSRRTVGAMAEQVAAGKVRYLGLSEVSGDTVRAAHAVHPISAVQSEWSLWTGIRESGVLPTLPRAWHRVRPVQPARPRLS